MTKVQTTYHKARMIDGTASDHPTDRGPNCESIELARMAPVPGPETAIIRSEWRLGGDGDWHITNTIVVELCTAQGTVVR